MARVHLYLTHLQDLTNFNNVRLIARGMTLHPCIVEYPQIHDQHTTRSHLLKLMDITSECSKAGIKTPQKERHAERFKGR